MNNLSYFEIQSDHPEQTASFYSKIFGWKCSKQEGMPIEYWHIETDTITGGILQRPAKIASGGGTNAFVCSMEVVDFDQTAKTILEHGGIEAMPKFAVPGKCWQGYFLDPEGNTFGLFQVDENAS